VRTIMKNKDKTIGRTNMDHLDETSILARMRGKLSGVYLFLEVQRLRFAFSFFAALLRSGHCAPKGFAPEKARPRVFLRKLREKPGHKNRAARRAQLLSR